jgi:hypothetical protein
MTLVATKASFKLKFKDETGMRKVSIVANDLQVLNKAEFIGQFFAK